LSSYFEISIITNLPKSTVDYKYSFAYSIVLIADVKLLAFVT